MVRRSLVLDLMAVEHTAPSQEKRVLSRGFVQIREGKDIYSVSISGMYSYNMHSSYLEQFDKDDKTPLIRGPVLQTLSTYRPHFFLLKFVILKRFNDQFSDLVCKIHSRFGTFIPKWLQTPYPLGGIELSLIYDLSSLSKYARAYWLKSIT